MLSIEIACPLEDQATLVMRWRNDLGTLANFYHREPKVWESFWPEFARDYFVDSELPPIFVRDDGKRVAFLRFKRISHPTGSARQCCDISINVDPEKRGMGYGAGSLKLATEYLRGRKVDDILAEIRVENLVSVNAFKKAGYVLLDQTIKHVDDTDERCPIYRYLRNVTPRAARALLIDMDGTLADSLGVMKSVYYRFLAEFRVRGAEVEFDSLNGPPLDEVVKFLKEKYCLPGSSGELLSRYMAMVKESYLEVKPNAGAEDLIAHAVDRGWACVVVTSNSEGLAREWLAKNKLLGTISEVVGKESIRVGKPDPEPYLVALRRIGCEAEKAIAVEDSAAGLSSASGARIQTFAYVPHHNAALGALPPEWSIIHNLLDLKPWLTHA